MGTVLYPGKGLGVRTELKLLAEQRYRTAAVDRTSELPLWTGHFLGSGPWAQNCSKGQDNT